MIIIFLFFWGTSILFSIVFAPMFCTFPPIVLKSSLFSTSSPWLSDNHHSNKWEVMSHCGFDLHSLIINNVEHLFMYLLAIFGKMPIHISHPCLNWVFCYWVVWVLCILYINLLSDTQFANIFSCSVGCLFILLMVYFAVQMFFSSM